MKGGMDERVTTGKEASDMNNVEMQQRRLAEVAVSGGLQINNLGQGRARNR